MAMSISPFLLLSQRHLRELHQPPHQIKNGWHGNPDEQKQKRIVEQTLHEGNGTVV